MHDHHIRCQTSPLSQREHLAALLDELETEHGPVPEHIRREVRGWWPGAGEPVEFVRADAHATKIDDGRAAVAEFESEEGAFTLEERRQGRYDLIEDGVIHADEFWPVS